MHDYHAFESFGISDLRDCAATVAAEAVSQYHAAVLLRCICLGCASGNFELVFGNEDVGGEGASTEVAARQAMADCLESQQVQGKLRTPTFITGSPSNL